MGRHEAPWPLGIAAGGGLEKATFSPSSKHVACSLGRRTRRARLQCHGQQIGNGRRFDVILAARRNSALTRRFITTPDPFRQGEIEDYGPRVAESIALNEPNRIVSQSGCASLRDLHRNDRYSNVPDSRTRNRQDFTTAEGLPRQSRTGKNARGLSDGAIAYNGRVSEILCKYGCAGEAAAQNRRRKDDIFLLAQDLIRLWVTYYKHSRVYKLRRDPCCLNGIGSASSRIRAQDRSRQ